MWSLVVPLRDAVGATVTLPANLAPPPGLDWPLEVRLPTGAVLCLTREAYDQDTRPLPRGRPGRSLAYTDRHVKAAALRRPDARDEDTATTTTALASSTDGSGGGGGDDDAAAPQPLPWPSLLAPPPPLDEVAVDARVRLLVQAALEWAAHPSADAHVAARHYARLFDGSPEAAAARRALAWALGPLVPPKSAEQLYFVSAGVPPSALVSVDRLARGEGLAAGSWLWRAWADLETAVARARAAACPGETLAAHLAAQGVAAAPAGRGLWTLPPQVGLAVGAAILPGAPLAVADLAATVVPWAHRRALAQAVHGLLASAAPSSSPAAGLVSRLCAQRGESVPVWELARALAADTGEPLWAPLPLLPPPPLPPPVVAAARGANGWSCPRTDLERRVRHGRLHRALGPDARALLDPATLERLHVPPCMAAVLTRARTTHHLVNSERRSVASWLAAMGFPDDVLDDRALAAVALGAADEAALDDPGPLRTMASSIHLARQAWTNNPSGKHNSWSCAGIVQHTRSPRAPSVIQCPYAQQSLYASVSACQRQCAAAHKAPALYHPLDALLHALDW